MFDWILNVVRTLGYPGIAILTLLENVVPPIPSELIMPFAGFLAERGDFAMAGAVAAGTAGSLAGAVGWYVVGRKVGEDRVRAFFRRHGRWAAVSGEQVDTAMAWFERHGGFAVLLGRLVPGVRTFISLPAGFTGMALLPFLLYTTIGTAAWTAALTYGGFVLGQNYEAVERYLSPVSWAIVLGIVAWYIYSVATYDSAADEAPPQP